MADCTCNNFPATLGNVTFGANVGIGTSPSARLHLRGAATQLLIENEALGGSSPAIVLNRIGQPTLGLQVLWDNVAGGAYFDNLYNNVAGNIYFRTRVSGTPVTAITILGTGEVGIGTPTPSALLHIKGSTPEFRIENTSTGGGTTEDPTIWLRRGVYDALGVKLWHDDDQGHLYLDNLYEDDTGNIYIRTKASAVLPATPITALTILGGGNVGIGTPTPSEKLEVNGNVKVAGKGSFGGPGGSQGAINVPAAGVYSYNTPQRYINLRSDGSGNDLESVGAVLYINFSGQPVDFVNGKVRIEAGGNLTVRGNRFYAPNIPPGDRYWFLVNGQAEPANAVLGLYSTADGTDKRVEIKGDVYVGARKSIDSQGRCLYAP